MSRGPMVAPADRVKEAVIVVLLTMVVAPIVRPVVWPAGSATTWTVVPVAVKPVPRRVTGTVVPRRPELGVIEARVGVPGLTTVKATGLLVPAGVVIVTFLAVSVAVGEMVSVVVAISEVPPGPPPTVTTGAVAVTPPPLTVTAVAPAKLVPLSVTGTLVPLAPALGEMEVRSPGGMITVNVTALLVPAGVVTVTFLAALVVPAENMIVAVTVVSPVTVRPVTVAPPDTLTAVVPVNPVPVRVIGIGVPRLPEVGLIEVSTGPVRVYGRLLVSPPPVRTKMLIGVSGVALVLVNVAVMDVALTYVTPVIVKPVGFGGAPSTRTVDVGWKFVPVRVTFIASPRNPEFGLMDVSVGAAAATTVNVMGPRVAVGVVTVTFLALSVAVGEITQLAVTEVAVAGAVIVQATPPPDTLTAVAPVRPVPEIVTSTVVPRVPLLGLMESRPPWPAPWNSTAPTSKWVGLDASGRGFP